MERFIKICRSGKIVCFPSGKRGKVGHFLCFPQFLTPLSGKQQQNTAQWITNGHGVRQNGLWTYLKKETHKDASGNMRSVDWQTTEN